MFALTANGVGTCGADDNQAQAGHLIAIDMRNATRPGGVGAGTQGLGLTVDGPVYTVSEVTQAVAYPLAVRGRDGGSALEMGEPGDPMFALRAGDGGSSRSQLVAVHENQRGELTTAATAVRRLTPLECERLQGAPDQWTNVDDASDSARYRQMGDSVAVPVLTWVLTRLAVVDAGRDESGAA